MLVGERLILRLRNPTGSIHYIESYEGETVCDLKKWIAEEYECTQGPLTLKHGENVLNDDTKTVDLPRDGFITICLLQDTRVVAKDLRKRKMSRAKRRQLKGMKQHKKVLISDTRKKKTG